MTYHVRLTCLPPSLFCLFMVKNYCWIIEWINHFRGMLYWAYTVNRLPNCPQSLSFALDFVSGNCSLSGNFSTSGLYNSMQHTTEVVYSQNTTYRGSGLFTKYSPSASKLYSKSLLCPRRNVHFSEYFSASGLHNSKPYHDYIPRKWYIHKMWLISSYQAEMFV